MSACVGDELSGCEFGDKRLTTRVVQLASSISDNPEASINAACGSIADSKGAYRFLQNGKVKPDKILAGHVDKTWARIRETSGPILMIQDTTDLIYTNFPSIKNLGQRLKDKNGGYQKGVTGLMLHTSLASSLDGVPLGVTKQTYFTFDEIKEKRDQKSTNQAGIQKTFPISEKASYRWIDHILSQNKVASDQKISLIHVADREADIYELLQIASSDSLFVIRSSTDRLSQGKSRRQDTPTISELVATSKPLGIIEFTHENKEIKCEIRHLSTTLRPPQRSPKAKEMKLEPIQMSIVDVIQINEDIDPIHWRLLTNLPCNSFEKALEIIKIYRQRWSIECFHKILKSGFKIEEARLADRQRIENFATVISIVSWFLFWLYKFGRSSPNLPAGIIFDNAAIKVMSISAKKLKVKVSPNITIGEALLIVARLGGFLGRKGDGDPGMKSIWQGWRRLADRLDFLETMDLE